jgi:hypothetical protein
MLKLLQSNPKNKEYLMSLVPNSDPGRRLDEWQAAEEQFMQEHPLISYLACMQEGRTRSEELGQVSIGKPQFSLKDRAHIGFSLRLLLLAKAK